MAHREKKDAVVIIFDTGQAVEQKHIKDGTIYYRKSKDCISWILKRKIMSMSKDLVCLLVTGTGEPGEPADNLNVSLCKNFSVKFDFQLASWDMLSYIDKEVKPSQNVSDWVGALAISTDKLKLLEETYNLNSKAVVIFSDMKNTFTDAADYSVTNIKDMNIEVTVIGPDYISLNPEYDEDEQPFSKRRRLHTEEFPLLREKKISGEKLLQLMWDSLGDLIRITNFDSALRQLSSYSRKTVRANPWNCIMDIGDLKIGIQVFKKIDRKIPLRANLKCVKPDSNKAEGSSQPTLTDVVRDKVMYYRHVEPDTVQTEEVSVGENEIVSGFRYGTSIIPFSDEDKRVLEYKPGEKCFSVLGFTRLENVPYYTLTGEGSYIVVPRENDEKSEVALSAITQAMSESGNVAIVRRVYSDDRGLSLGVLYPVVEEGQPRKSNHKECLVFIELGFHEDIRKVHLPSLKKLKKKIIPRQYRVINELIEEMDLMKVKSGFKGDTFEALDLCSRHEVKNQFFQHCVVQKVLYPDKPLPRNLPAHCEKYITQLQAIKNRSVFFGQKLTDLFSTKKSGDSKTEKGNSIMEDLYYFSDIEEKTAMNCFKRLFATRRYPHVADILHLLKIAVNDFKFNVQDIVQSFLHFTRMVRQDTLSDFSDDFNFWIKKLRVNLGVEGELAASYWKVVYDEHLGVITWDEHKDSCSKPEEKAVFYDSLTRSTQETEEERRRMEEEVEEAVRLF